MAGPEALDRATRPTLEAVAAAAGVSRSTVSRVVNGSPKVSREVLTAVTAAISRLGYVPNRAARALAGRRTQAVALVVPEDLQRFFGDPFFAVATRGIHDRLSDDDYVLTLVVSSGDPAEAGDRLTRTLLHGGVDGALVLSHHEGDLGLVDLARRLPVVFGGRPLLPGLTDPYWVDVDNRGGAQAATRHLVGRGRTRIATVAGPKGMPAAVDRLDGWRSVLAEHGLSDKRRARGDFTVASGAAAMRKLLKRHPDLDAVFVASDLMAEGALTVLAEAGRKVPKQVAVVGFDDAAPRGSCSGPVPLTTVAQPSEQLGRQLATMIITLLDGGQPETRELLLPTELVVRRSS